MYFNRITLLLMHLGAIGLVVTADNPLTIFLLGLLLSYIMRNILLSAIYHKLFAHNAFTPKSWVPTVGNILGFVYFMPPSRTFYVEHITHHRLVDTEEDILYPGRNIIVRTFPFLFNRVKLVTPEVAKLKRTLAIRYEEKNPWSKKFNLEFRMVTIIVAYLSFYVIDYNLFSVMLVSASLFHYVGYVGNVVPHNRFDADGKAITTNHRWLSWMLWATDFDHKDHHDKPKDLHYGPVGPAKTLQFIVGLLSSKQRTD